MAKDKTNHPKHHKPKKRVGNVTVDNNLGRRFEKREKNGGGGNYWGQDEGCASPTDTRRRHPHPTPPRPGHQFQPDPHRPRPWGLHRSIETSCFGDRPQSTFGVKQRGAPQRGHRLPFERNTTKKTHNTTPHKQNPTQSQTQKTQHANTPDTDITPTNPPTPTNTTPPHTGGGGGGTQVWCRGVGAGGVVLWSKGRYIPTAVGGGEYRGEPPSALPPAPPIVGRARAKNIYPGPQSSPGPTPPRTIIQQKQPSEKEPQTTTSETHKELTHHP